MQDFRIEPKDEGDVAYAQGMEAEEQGLSRAENPYKGHTEMNDQWDTGWCDQYYDTYGEYAPPLV